jgi:hypothetical protein
VIAAVTINTRPRLAFTSAGHNSPNPLNKAVVQLQETGSTSATSRHETVPATRLPGM